MTTRYLKRLALNLAAVFMLIVAALFHQEHLYLMAATLFLIPVVGNLVGRVLIGGLVCERSVPSSCSVGERVTITLSVTAAGSLPKFSLRVQDRLPRWLDLVGDPPSLILYLASGETSMVRYALEPGKRGIYSMTSVQVQSTDPLGFSTSTRTVPCASMLTVYPTVSPLRRLFLEGGGASGLRSLDEGAARGDGLDFHGVREYRHGDDLRRVHWRTTARTGKLAVMEYTQGVSSDVFLALDLNRAVYQDTGEGPQSALECAIRAVASVAAYLLRQGYGVRLLSQQTGGEPMILKGADSMPQLLQALVHAEADSPQTLAEVLAASRARAAGNILFFVTPDPSLVRDSILNDYHVMRTRVFGLVMDAGTFGPAGRADGSRHRPGEDMPLTLDPAIRTFRRGDDLQQTLEGWGDGRS